jgi:DNA-directed RNA polymerase subunit RPC12/RpoP
MGTVYQCFDCGTLLRREEIGMALGRDEISSDEIVRDPYHCVCGKCGGRIILLAVS